MLSGRYPVGYDPDNRTRPQAVQSLKRPQRTDSPNNMPLCMPVCELKPKPKWEPPIGYDPKNRKLHLRALVKDEVLETINFVNDYDADTKLKLCTGIWLGNKILQKKCVWLDYDEK